MTHSLALRPATAALAALVLAPLASTQTEKDYRALTDTWHSFTHFNLEVVRGMAIVDTTLMYAVHPTQSTLVRYSPNFYTESERWRTLNGPVSVGVYGGDVFVVCQASNALVRHDPSDGRILDVLATLAEPADLAIDADNGWAYVSCMGSDAVLRVELASPLRILDVWSWEEGLRLKRPRFLHLDRREEGDPGDNVLLVAPLISGNNTLITADAQNPALNVTIHDAGPGGVLTQGLPDEDLFLIDPQATGPQVFPMVTGAGSLILAHGRHPTTGDYWILNVNHRNADTLGEPAARGIFADNRVTIVRESDLPDPGGTPASPATHVISDLDDLDPLTNDVPGYPATYSTALSVPFPYSLFFLGAGGAVVASSMNDRLVAVDDDGNRAATASTSNPALGIEGSIVRQLAAAGPYFLAYCQGTSNIVVYHFGLDPDEPIYSIPLGEDPTPEPIRAGRAIWYDGTRSMDGRTSCNTCHPQGLADGLAWEISGFPADEKGPMVTQPLCGIEDTFPYHWRGERRLDDFNVFRELLGGPANLDEEELAQFMSFIFSLTCPPNPVQYGPPALDAAGRLVLDLDRRIKTSLTPYLQGVEDPGAPLFQLVGNPVEGERIFHEEDSDGFEGGPVLGACVNCHTNPTSGSGDWTPDAPDRIPSKSNIEVAHLDNQLTLKRQPLVSVVFGPSPGFGADTVVSNLLGFGTSHTGDLRGHFDFINNFFGPLSPLASFDDQQVADLAAFVDVFDNGLAPAAQWAVRLHAGAAAGTEAAIQAHLVDQAEDGWLGVAVVGRFRVNGVLEELCWFYDTQQDAFVPDDRSLVAPQPLSAFADFSLDPDPDNVFFGVPPGNERRLSVDADGDGLDLGGELVELTDPWRADSDGDGWPDGYEVDNDGEPDDPDPANGPDDNSAPGLVGPLQLDFVNAAQAKFLFRTDEPASWTLTLDLTPPVPGVPRVVCTSDHPDTYHTAVAQGLKPSTIFGAPQDDKHNVYSGTLVLTDLSGNPSAPIPVSTFEAGSLAKGSGTAALDLTEIGALRHLHQPVAAQGGVIYESLVRVKVVWREGGPPALAAPDQVVVGQLLERDPNGLDWIEVPGSEIVTNATASDFVLLPTLQLWGSGVSIPDCSDLSGFQAGDLLVLPPTNASGTAEVRFTVLGGNGKEFQFNVVAIVPVSFGLDPCDGLFSYDPATPIFDPPDTDGAVLIRWVVPATMLAKKRSVAFVQ